MREESLQAFKVGCTTAMCSHSTTYVVHGKQDLDLDDSNKLIIKGNSLRKVCLQPGLGPCYNNIEFRAECIDAGVYPYRTWVRVRTVLVWLR